MENSRNDDRPKRLFNSNLLIVIAYQRFAAYPIENDWEQQQIEYSDIHSWCRFLSQSSISSREAVDVHRTTNWFNPSHPFYLYGSPNDGYRRHAPNHKYNTTTTITTTTMDASYLRYHHQVVVVWVSAYRRKSTTCWCIREKFAALCRNYDF